LTVVDEWGTFRQFPHHANDAVLATFAIGFREGIEAALIVGIVAAFLNRRGRGDAVKLVWVGVALAVLICTVFAIGIQLLSASLPQAQQESLEASVDVVAVTMVTYMVIWMRRNSRGLKGHLEESTSAALAQGTAWALVATAFLAVLREGFETATFLLAAFNASESPVAAGFGVVLGLVLAAFVGYGIYRGGLRINLGRLFRVTGFVLVIVAAGLVMSGLHSAHEAGWLDAGQATFIDLGGLVQPGTMQESLLTGVLGLQPEPTVVETIGWLAYAGLMAIVVLWPNRRRPAGRGSSASTVELRPAAEVHPS